MCLCPVLLEPDIVLNTKDLQLWHEPVLQPVQVCVLTIKDRQRNTVRIAIYSPPQPISRHVEDCVPIPRNNSDSPWSRTQRSLIGSLVHGTLITKNDFSAFRNGVECLYQFCTCIPFAV